MDAYERSQLADALKVENFKKDDKIITEGEPGDKFYILEEPPMLFFGVENGSDRLLSPDEFLWKMVVSDVDLTVCCS